MVSRLVLAQARTDSEGASFPYVDVRIAYASTLGASKGGASLQNGNIVSPFNIELRIRYYRVSSGARIFLAEDYRPVEQIFIVPGTIPDPGVGDSDRLPLLYFFDYIWIGTTPSLLSTYGQDADDWRDQVGSENPFEAIDIDSPIPFPSMLNCLDSLLRNAGGPDFVGLTVVEDS
jgi:hypothetical protein